MPRTAKKLELFKEDEQSEALIPFTFKFSNEGNYEAWEVWSNGVERAEGKSSGEIKGVIRTGTVLKVEFKVWDGGYSITYSCTGKRQDDEKPSPINGTAIGAGSRSEIIRIQF
jgi:hypothetical protein